MKRRTFLQTLIGLVAATGPAKQVASNAEPLFPHDSFDLSDYEEGTPTHFPARFTPVITISGRYTRRSAILCSSTALYEFVS
jgi:hypothetical protein